MARNNSGVRGTSKCDVIIIGAGHNGLVAACYLAKAGKRVVVLEANSSIGGAAVSQYPFAEYDAKLSRYAYLVSLLPDKIVRDLNLDFSTAKRRISSYTVDRNNLHGGGLLVHSDDHASTAKSFDSLTNGKHEYAAWKNFYARTQRLARVVAPTLLEPLPTKSDLAQRVENQTWQDFFEQPLGAVLEREFHDDLVRGVVLTDGLIGTYASANNLSANRCFLYHVIGNGNGDWNVPIGGMGRLTSQLEELAERHGVEIICNARVSLVESDGNTVRAVLSDGGAYESHYLLGNCAPQELERLMGEIPTSTLEGSQVKVNMLLSKLPRLKSGIDPRLAFAGTFHFDERYSQLEQAYLVTREGKIPETIPGEMYCHTLSDSSILSDELNARGFQTLTLFALHTPATLFDADETSTKSTITTSLLRQLNDYFVDPIEECLATNKDGSLCIETKSPLELEREIGLPRGNIFHRELSFPYRDDDAPPSWGVETRHPNVMMCGAGAIRGGGVSGIPGHNAAAAILSLG